MIKLPTKIVQAYGLPVAVSLAKQAIEQNGSLVRELKTHKNRIIEKCIITKETVLNKAEPKIIENVNKNEQKEIKNKKRQMPQNTKKETA